MFDIYPQFLIAFWALLFCFNCCNSSSRFCMLSGERSTESAISVVSKGTRGLSLFRGVIRIAGICVFLSFLLEVSRLGG